MVSTSSTSTSSTSGSATSAVLAHTGPWTIHTRPSDSIQPIAKRWSLLAAPSHIRSTDFPQCPMLSPSRMRARCSCLPSCHAAAGPTHVPTMRASLACVNDTSLRRLPLASSSATR